MIGKCPKCGKEEGLQIDTAKELFKCFKCGNVSGNSAVSFLMKGKDMTYPEALEFLNSKYTFFTNEPVKKVEKPLKNKKGKLKSNASFCDRMLAESGLTYDDVKANIISIDKNNTNTIGSVFKSGTFDSKFNVDKNGDDVIIEYYDLEGIPVMYEEKEYKNYKLVPTGRKKPFFRVRYQYQEEHKDRDGKEMKYQSPPGSGSHIYIPDKIRQIYKRKEKLTRLFIQEGEKKAEKACKHGIMSVGVSGIQNLAQNKELSPDLTAIIQKLEVKEVIFVFDSDYNDLSQNIKITDSVDKRPRNFFYAAANYKKYMLSLKIRNIYVEIYLGNVLKNKKGNKGIDDLLADTLADNPEALEADINRAMLSKEGKGDYMQFYQITSWSDSRLEEIWNLNNPEKFASAHYEELKELPEFKINKHVWKFDAKAKLISAQPIEAYEQFWVEEERKSGEKWKTVYEYVYEHALIFLQNRGFGKFKSIDGTIKFMHVQHPCVNIVDHFYIKDYVKKFIRDIGKAGVLEMLHRGGPQYLGPDKLSDLQDIFPSFEVPDRTRQRFYFKSCAWEVTDQGIKSIEYSNVTWHIWEDEKKDFDPQLFAPLIDVQKDSFGKWNYKLTKEGESCHFLQFLINASNFTWIKEKQIADGNTDVIIAEDEYAENRHHVVSKLAAIGYMLLKAKDKSVTRAVIAMDGRQSEVGDSKGRTGKSLVGDALSKCIPSVYIPGKNKDMETDNFLWTEITDKTSMVFIDDVRVNFNFEFLFPNLTGDWKVNYKGGGRVTIPFSQSPKIFLPTNHAINGRGSSFEARQWKIAFSDFYNEKHQPPHDFGCLFFDDWEFTQWNLFWNLMATCVHIYLKHGVVEAPGDRIAARQMRQEMGESFLAWAEEYFSNPERLNTRLVKNAVYGECLQATGYKQTLWSVTKFKKSIKLYCEWAGLRYNLNLYDPETNQPLFYDKDGRVIEDDKSGGVEYISLWNQPYKKDTNPTVTTSGEVVPGEEKPF